MKILLDQDNVLCDTMGSAFRIIKQEQGIDVCHADITDYWFKDAPVPPETFIGILRRPNFYRELDVITGAVEAVNALRKRHDVTVCTMPMKGAEFCEDEKREWLAKYFDDQFAEQAIITHDKSLFEADYLIDDNPEAVSKSWETIIFDAAWNRHHIFKHRMFGWHDVKRVIR